MNNNPTPQSAPPLPPPPVAALPREWWLGLDYKGFETPSPNGQWTNNSAYNNIIHADEIVHVREVLPQSASPQPVSAKTMEWLERRAKHMLSYSMLHKGRISDAEEAELLAIDDVLCALTRHESAGGEPMAYAVCYDGVKELASSLYHAKIIVQGIERYRPHITTEIIPLFGQSAILPPSASPSSEKPPQSAASGPDANLSNWLSGSGCAVERPAPSSQTAGERCQCCAHFFDAPLMRICKFCWNKATDEANPPAHRGEPSSEAVEWLNQVATWDLYQDHVRAFARELLAFIESAQPGRGKGEV